jgi:hypothetical protein
MQSRDYYVPYHEKSGNHVELLAETRNCDDFAIEVVKLAKTGKVNHDNDEWIEKITELLGIESNSRQLFDVTLKTIIRKESLQVAFENFLQENCRTEDVVFALKITFGSEKSAENFIKRNSFRLISELCNESSPTVHFSIVNIIRRVIEVNPTVGLLILDRIMEVSLEKNDDLARRNLCYFIKKIVAKTPSIDELLIEKIMKMYFIDKSSHTRQQLIYIAKVLIQSRILSKEMENNFKIIVIVIESVIENKVNLLTIELINQIDRKSESSMKIKFALLKHLSNCENVLARNTSIKHLLRLDQFDCDQSEIFGLMEMLNNPRLYHFDYENRAVLYDKLLPFVNHHFDTIFPLFTKIDWEDLAAFEFIRAFSEVILTRKNFNQNFKEILKTQVDEVPKNSKHLITRLTFQNIYNTIASHVGVLTNFASYPRAQLAVTWSGKISDQLDKAIEEMTEGPENINCLKKLVETLYGFIKTKEAWSSSESRKGLVDRMEIIFKAIMKIECDEAFEIYFQEFRYSLLCCFGSSPDAAKEFMNACAERILENIGTYPEKRSQLAFKLLYFKITREPSRTSSILHQDNKVSDFFKKMIVDKIFEVYVLDEVGQNYEALIDLCDEYYAAGGPTLTRKQARLVCARFLSDIDFEGYHKMMESKLEGFDALNESYEKGSLTHRLKLRYLQAMVHMKNASGKIIEVLVNQLLFSWNLEDVTLILEIILAHFHPNILDLLESETLPQESRKSIATIASMQVRMLTDYNAAMQKLESFYEVIATMSFDSIESQTFVGVAFIKSCEHVKKLQPKKSQSKDNLWIDTTSSSLRFLIIEKAGTEFFEQVCEDFRFDEEPDDLFTVDIIYKVIPEVHEMPYEEIIENSRDLILLGPKDVSRPVFGWSWKPKVVSWRKFVDQEAKVDVVAKYEQTLSFPVDFLTAQLPFHYGKFQEKDADFTVIMVKARPCFEEMKLCEVLTEDVEVDYLKLTREFNFKKKIVDGSTLVLHEKIKKMKESGVKIITVGQNGSNLDDIKLPRKVVILLFE